MKYVSGGNTVDQCHDFCVNLKKIYKVMEFGEMLELWLKIIGF
jgi:hypothetical protein